MNLKSKDIKYVLLMLIPFLLGLFIFYIIPLIISLYYSLTNGISGFQFVGLKNFIDLFSNEAFILATKNTLKFTIISIPLIVIISLILALLINSKLKNISLFRTIFILPIVIPVSSVILTWQLLFQNNGIINSFLVKLNLSSIDWLNSEYSIFILIILFIWKNSAYNIILFLVGLNNIPHNYYEAARIDGCSKVRLFIHITLPLLMPTTIFVIILSIANSFKVYREAYLLGGDYPTESMYMIQHFMTNNFNNLNYQRLSTSAFIIFTIITLIIYLFYKYNNEK